MALKYIKRRKDVDMSTTRARKVKRSYGIYIYFTILAIFVIWLFRLTIGDYFIFRAQGETTTNRAAVEAAMNAQVIGVFVEPGQFVEINDPLLQIASMDYQTLISDLRSQLASTRLNLLSTLENVDVLKSQEKELQSRLDQLTNEENKVVSDEAVFAQMQLEANATRITLSDATQALEEIKRLELQIQTLEELYDSGLVRASVSGHVDLDIVNPGEVVNTGEKMLNINLGRPFVRAYIPDRYLCEVKIGDEVNVAIGSTNVRGKVFEILPIAHTPNEGRPKNMSLSDKPGQVMSVEVDESAKIAVGHDVIVTKLNEFLCLGPLGAF